PHCAPCRDRGEQAQCKEKTKDELAADEQSGPGVGAAHNDSAQEPVIGDLQEPERTALNGCICRVEKVAPIERPAVIVLRVVKKRPANDEARQEQEPGGW